MHWALYPRNVMHYPIACVVGRAGASVMLRYGQGCVCTYIVSANASNQWSCRQLPIHALALLFLAETHVATSVNLGIGKGYYPAQVAVAAGDECKQKPMRADT